jgi:hypothetical protein
MTSVSLRFNYGDSRPRSHATIVLGLAGAVY